MAAITWLLLVTWLLTPSHGNHFAKKLYDDLLRKSGYNRIIRPVQNDSDVIIVTIGLKLSQLIDVDEKNQFMTTNVWVNQEWHDSSLTWDPDEYGSVNMLYVPARDIWHPDIVLYNNADGKYEMTPDTKATIYHDGRVRWQPPASFKSSCNIDVTYFPFDEQKCDMKFGSWTYNRYEVEMLHSWQQLNSSMGQLEFPKLTVGVDLKVNLMHQWSTPDQLDTDSTDIELGTDLKAFYKNVEWDLMAAPAHKSTIYYAGAEDPYSEWTFSVRLKRKFLFYTVNLIIPLVSHAFMTILVFYLPADSKEKISLSINILLSMTVFFLLLAEIIPPTSIVVPLLAKYLIFTMFLVVASVIVTVFTYNIHFRSLATHTMPDWMRKVFLYWLPRLLMMRRPKIENAHDVELKHIKLKLCGCLDAEHDHRGGGHGHGGGGGGYSASRQRMNAFEMRYQFGSKRTRTQAELMKLSRELDEDTTSEAYSNMCPEVKNAIEGAIFIANHLKEEDEFNRTKEDWKYIALVIDRLFLYLYLAICVFGTIGIIAGAPMLYDRSIPIVFDQSQAGTATPTHTTVIGTT